MGFQIILSPPEPPPPWMAGRARRRVSPPLDLTLRRPHPAKLPSCLAAPPPTIADPPPAAVSPIQGVKRNHLDLLSLVGQVLFVGTSPPARSRWSKWAPADFDWARPMTSWSHVAAVAAWVKREDLGFLEVFLQNACFPFFKSAANFENV